MESDPHLYRSVSADREHGNYFTSTSSELALAAAANEELTDDDAQYLVDKIRDTTRSIMLLSSIIDPPIVQVDGT